MGIRWRRRTPEPPWGWIDGSYVHPGNYALVKPLPPGTTVGNVAEMARAAEPFHEATVALVNDPDPNALKNAVAHLTRNYVPGRVDAEIMAQDAWERDNAG
jgi:hypothetical protein